MGSFITKIMIIFSIICLLIVPSSLGLINNNIVTFNYVENDSYVYYNYQNMTDLFFELSENNSEIMLLDSSLKSVILKTHDSNRIKNEALNLNMVTLRQDGIEKVLDGISTIEEIVRVTHK